MYAVIVDVAEHNGRVVRVGPKSHPNEYCLRGESVWGEFRKEKDALAELEKYRKCEATSYCFTHNKGNSR